MPTARLTQRTLTALQPKPDRQFVVWDTELTGFGVRVSPGGTKTFLFAYRTPGGRQRWKTLGRVGAVALEQARTLAKVDVGVVASKQDPLRQVDVARSALSVANVADRWKTEAVAHLKPTTVRGYTYALEHYIVPAIGRLSIGDVGAGDVVAFHDSLRRIPTQANRVLRTLSSLLTWSMRGNRPYRTPGPNPCFGIELYPENKRKTYLTEKDYARVGRVLRSAKVAPNIKLALRLLLLTGARPIEIATLQWSSLDLKNHVIHLPDSKTGPKDLYLSPAAVALLKRWPRHAHSTYVFPGTGRRQRGAHLHPSTLTHTWADLRDTMALPDVRLYDSRHSYASVAASVHGLSLPQIGKQLGHTQPSTTQRYAHLSETVAKQHAKQIGGTIAAALGRRK